MMKWKVLLVSLIVTLTLVVNFVLGLLYVPKTKHISTFKERYSEITVTLKGKSWNPISVPFKDALIDESDCTGDYVKKIFYWDANKKQYFYVKDLKEIAWGRGYWIYAKRDCTFKVSGSIPTSMNNVNLYGGWNFILGIGGVTKGDIESKCHVEKGPYYYNPQSKRWEKVNELEEGKGYWVKCSKVELSDCVLNEYNWEVSCNTNCKHVEGKPTIVLVKDNENNMAIAIRDDVKKGDLTVSNGKLIFSTEPSLSMLNKEKNEWEVVLVCSEPIGQVREGGVK